MCRALAKDFLIHFLFSYFWIRAIEIILTGIRFVIILAFLVLILLQSPTVQKIPGLNTLHLQIETMSDLKREWQRKNLAVVTYVIALKSLAFAIGLLATLMVAIKALELSISGEKTPYGSTVSILDKDFKFEQFLNDMNL